MIATFKRVLVTTDFSEAGDAAVPHAFRIASDHGAEVVLCHVIETPPTPNPLYAHYSSTEYRLEARLQAEQKAHEALRARVPKDATLAAVPYRTRVVDGDPVLESSR
jgi:nucleotide-binding universal stress UspA family protein